MDNNEFERALSTPTHMLTDAELSSLMKSLVAGLNELSVAATKRELIIRYDVKPQNPGNPTLKVQVLSEVA